MKKIALCLGFVLATATLGVVGCDEPANNGGMDMTMNGGGDMAMQGQADMSFVCNPDPMMGNDFLNSCAPGSIQFVDITPFYPALAPGGVLPPLN